MRRFLIFFLTTISCILLVILLGLLFTSRQYFNWEMTFENSMKAENLIEVDTNLGGDVDEKIVKYTLSSKDVENLQLKPKEVGYIVFTTISDYNSDIFSFSKVYIQPHRAIWNICAEISFKGIKLKPWVCIDVNKDNVQTAQLYVSDLRIGPFSVSEYGSLLEKVNSGLANSLLTVNENGFSGRYFENIELLEDMFVVKGSQY